MNRICTFIGLLFFAGTVISAQELIQSVRGKIYDRVTQQPIPGVNVVVDQSKPVQGATTANDGWFKISNIKTGRITLVISCIGYKTVVLPNLIVTSTKEVITDVPMDEEAVTGSEVVITGTRGKDLPTNRMATVSSRGFTVEETEKYAGSRGDVARMAMNFAGVVAGNDQRNDIVIRGNSPSGLLWKLDDIEIPNPNHFAENGTTGGPVNMLNNNLLKNSDFYTGAFPAEYSNAMSGVFDLKLRSGNNEKHEFLFQTGFNGFEAGAEGPISRKNRSSYLVNFRYSTLELVDKIIDLGTTGVPEYKDGSFKLNFPVKHGNLSVFGLVGWSRIAMLDSKGEGSDLYSGEGQDLINHSKLGVIGGNYTLFLSNNTWLRLSLSGLYSEGGTNIDTLNNTREPHPYLRHNYLENRASAGLTINSRLSPSLSVRSGISVDQMGFDLNTRIINDNRTALEPVVQSKVELGNGLHLIKGYAQASYKVGEKLTFNPGISSMLFSLNGSFSVEPRLGATYEVAPSTRINAGYGNHSRMQTLYTYYYLGNGSTEKTNLDLGFSKGNHYVLGVDQKLWANTRLKAEGYYQQLYNIPVEKRATAFSLVNSGAFWGMMVEDSLVNRGTGKNYGAEITLERFLSKGFYYLSTFSWYNSLYKGSDGVERNTAFNGNFVWNILAGKEFELKKGKVLAFDAKFTYAGGKRYTPLDLAKSQRKASAYFIEEMTNTLQFDPFVKLDTKVTFRFNAKRVTQEWQFYIENVTNHQNPLVNTYSVAENKEKIVYQLGMMPMVTYRLTF